MRTLLTRFAHMLFVLWVVATILFFLFRLMPGDPTVAYIDTNFTDEQVAQLRKTFGLDRPLHEQYVRFIVAALHGDFGTSYMHAQPSLALIVSRMPATVELVLAGMAVAVAVGLPLGLVAGYWPRHWVSRVLSSISILGISVPAFWVGLMLIMLFALGLGLLPTGGRGETVAVFGIETSLMTADGLAHMALPALTLSLFPMALVLRLTRAGVRDGVVQ
jgi:peptide/nickel transport system permease protein